MVRQGPEAETLREEKVNHQGFMLLLNLPHRLPVNGYPAASPSPGCCRFH